MTSNDKEKILKAGFIIIRSDLDNLKIKKLSGSHAWSTLESNFKNKTAVLRRMKELLESDTIIAD